MFKVNRNMPVELIADAFQKVEIRLESTPNISRDDMLETICEDLQNELGINLVHLNDLFLR